MRRIFRYLEPTCFSGLIEDPCLVIRDRPIHRSIMIDCGSLQHLAKRELKPIDAIFVSHAHMDHFMGFDAFLRQVHASPRTVRLFGPPGFAERVEARLSGYDWNLCEPYWCTFQVTEVHPDRLKTCEFSGPDAFSRRETGELPRDGGPIYSRNHLEVAAKLLDHGIPVLSFRVTERKIFNVDIGKIAACGLVQGEWLRELKKRYYSDWTLEGPIKILRAGNDSVSEDELEDARSLYESIRGPFSSSSLGYVTDIGFSGENRASVLEFLEGVTMLVAECAFLREDMHKARASRHLCSADMNELLSVLKPGLILPIHLSKTYLGRSDELFAELSPPAGTAILRLPEHLAPRPVYSCDMPDLNFP